MTKHTVHKITDGIGNVKGWAVIKNGCEKVAESATVEEACAVADKLDKAVPNLQETVERMQREVKEDVTAGRVPANVESFSELYDHVDANEYGGFCEDDLADAWIEHFGGRDADEGMPDGFIAFMNDAQNAIDTWIKEGGLRG